MIGARYVLFGLLAACGAAAQANPWQELAKSDLEFIRASVVANHPGFVDPDNPGFRTRLEQNYRSVLSELVYVRSLDAVLNLDREFVASFADVHFELILRFAASGERWAGIEMARRRDRFVVARTADAWPVELPAPGSELVRCDKDTADDLMRRDVLRYRYADYDSEFPRARYASRLLIDDGVGFRVRPSKCEFLDASGNAREYGLRWIELDDAHTRRDVPRTSAAAQNFDVERLARDTLWIRASLFPATAEEGRNSFERMLLAVADACQENPAAIVLDVRGNGGGDSFLGVRLLHAALGQTTGWRNIEKAEAGAVPANFRASADNLRAIRAQIVAEQRGPDYVRFKTALAEAMQRDLAAHHDFTPQPKFELSASAAELARATRSAASDAPPPAIWLVTDSHCASACLDFVRALLTIPGVVQVGETTGADSRYNEPLRFADPFELPSHLGWFHLPSKIAGARGPYLPSIRFEGDIDDTRAVQQWVMNLVESRQR